MAIFLACAHWAEGVVEAVSVSMRRVRLASSASPTPRLDAVNRRFLPMRRVGASLDADRRALFVAMPAEVDDTIQVRRWTFV